MIIAKDKFEDLKRIGSLMSNLCFNLSQHRDRVLEPHEQTRMVELYRAWDEAKRAIVPVAKVPRRG